MKPVGGFMRLLFLSILVAVLLPSARFAFANSAAVAAQVLYVSGKVTAGGVDLKKGDSITVGALIETSAEGHLYMRAIDGGFLVVRSNSKAIVSSYDVAASKQVQIKIELLEGTARSITGTAAQQDKDGFRFNTPVAAIGIRGTDFTVRTNDQETVISVASGAVAVSPLSDTCLASGFGPCTGDFVVDLNATDRGFLRVVKGVQVPELIKDSSQAPSAPIPGETSSATGGSGTETASASGGSPELAPVYEDRFARGDLTMGGSGGEDGSGATDPQPRALSPEESGVSWGRWQAVADAPPNSELFNAAIGSDHYGLRLIGPFFLASQADRVYSRPVESQLSFVPVASEAYLGVAGQSVDPASIRNGGLLVDFNLQTFRTQFDVVNGQGVVGINVQGSVGGLGNLEADVIRSNAQFAGYLEGEGATHGTSLFSTFGDSPLRAFGSVQWAR